MNEQYDMKNTNCCERLRVNGNDFCYMCLGQGGPAVYR